jgi:hypothetical protein
MLDTTTKALEAITKTALSIDEWDEIPMLLIVSASGKNTFAVLDGDIYEMLATVGSRLRESVGNDITGLVLVNEGWGLSSKVSETANLQAEVDELRRTGRRFADHPAAIEIKIFTAIDREGIEYRQIERGDSEARKPDGQMGGRMIGALKALFDEVTR